MATWIFFYLLLATALQFIHAQSSSSNEYYTVWSSVVFSRTGERTPTILGETPTQLTSLGAQEAFSAGQSFRDRYLTGNGSTNGLRGALIYGLDQNNVDPRYVYVQALDYQYTVATAQAWMQGFYPPANLNASGGSLVGDASQGIYVQNPLNGYRYVNVQTAGGSDDQFPYLGAQLECPGGEAQYAMYQESQQYTATAGESAEMYLTIGPGLLSEVLPLENCGYYNAYAIYDYLNYQNAYNASVQSSLASPVYADPLNNISFLDAARWYADQQQYGRFTNISQVNTYSSGVTFDSGTTGSISTLPGNFLAAKLLSQLQTAVEYRGEYYKFSLLVGDFEPLLSFFALANLPDRNENFHGLPDFGSVAVFELFSVGNYNANSSFPDESDLLVRFYFRNGTDLNPTGTNDIYQDYPLFNRDPNEAEMPWTDFVDLMSGIAVGDIGDWCLQCGAEQLFCAAFNASLQDAQFQHSDSHSSLSPAVGGVIGAVVTLAFIALLTLLAIFLGGLRVHHATPRSPRLSHGILGYRGSRRMQSDQDLSIPKKTEAVGTAVVETEDPMSPQLAHGHERVGSWELRHQQGQAEMTEQHVEDQRQDDERLSLESSLDAMGKPVQAEERV